MLVSQTAQVHNKNQNIFETLKTIFLSSTSSVVRVIPDKCLDLIVSLVRAEITRSWLDT